MKVIEARREAIEVRACDVELDGIKGSGTGVGAKVKALAVGKNPLAEHSGAEHEKAGDFGEIEGSPDIGAVPNDRLGRWEGRVRRRRRQGDRFEVDVFLKWMWFVRPVERACASPDGGRRVLGQLMEAKRVHAANVSAR
jgi:hypothetical protein